MPKNISEKQVLQAAAVLQKGGTVVFPTDTSYGLAVDATNTRAVERLYAMKGRDFNKPIHVIPPSLSYVDKIAVVSVSARRLINKFWPGLLTLVLPLKTNSWALARLKGEYGLGFRMPQNRYALMLVEALGKPITATSANISGKPDNYTVPGIKKQFFRQALKPDFYLDAGRLPKVAPSTVVFWIKIVLQY